LKNQVQHSHPRFLSHLACLALLLVISAGCAAPGSRLDTLWDAPSFVLTDETGQPFHSDTLAGKVWLIDFIYTNCPDECPIYLSPKMHMLQEQIKGKKLAGKVELISLSVDPKRDTPQVLADYAVRFSADPQIWHFLTGADATIEPLLVNGFKVGSAIMQTPVTVTPLGTGESYTLLHTPYFLLVDQHGKIRKTYDGTEVAVEQLLADIQQLV
jgi:protein SCO1